MAYATALTRLRRRRWVRRRGHVGRVHDRVDGAAVRPRPAPAAQHPLGRRAEAAGAGVPAARTRPGAAARRARQLPRRARQDLARGPDPRVGQDDPLHQPRPRAARQHRDAHRHRRARQRGQPRVDPPRRLRELSRGARRPVRALRGDAAPLGRGAREAQGARPALQDQGRVQRRPGLAVQGRPDPAAEVRGGRPAGRAAAGAAGDDAAQGRPHRQARGRLHRPRAERADEAVRPRGLVRRARGRARLQRVRQVALPAAAGRRRQRPRRRAPARRRHASRRGAAHGQGQARRPGATGVVRADARAPRAGRPDAAGDPAPRRRPPRRDGPRGRQPGARPLRARARR